jgi:hypothetical protein
MEKRRTQPGKPRGLSMAALLPIGIGLLGLMRQISDLADQE